MSGLHPLHAKTATGSAAAEDVLRGLIPLATHLVVSQLDAFSSRLSNAFLAMSEQSMDSREANLSFNAGQILKKCVCVLSFIVCRCRKSISPGSGSADFTQAIRKQSKYGNGCRSESDQL
jgi:hypothetical protein